MCIMTKNQRELYVLEQDRNKFFWFLVQKIPPVEGAVQVMLGMLFPCKCWFVVRIVESLLESINTPIHWVLITVWLWHFIRWHCSVFKHIHYSAVPVWKHHHRQAQATTSALCKHVINFHQWHDMNFMHSHTSLVVEHINKVLECWLAS